MYKKNNLMLITSFCVILFNNCSNITDSKSPENFNGWEKTFVGIGSETGNCIQETSDKGYIIIGSARTTNNTADPLDIFVFKTDSSGNLIWKKYFGGDNNDVGYSIREVENNEFVMLCETKSFGYTKVWMIKIDSQGEELWNTFHTTNNDSQSTYNYAYSFEELEDGGFIFAGKELIYNSNLWIVKTDPFGNKIWEYVLNYTDPDQLTSTSANSIIPNDDGSYLAVGNLYYWKANKYEALIVKISSNGEYIWHKTYSIGKSVKGISIGKTNDDNFIIFGEAYFGASSWHDIWLMKIDTSGNKIWENTYGGDESDYSGKSIAVTQDGGFIFTGGTWSYGNKEEMFFIKTDYLGNIEWQEIIGEEKLDHGNYVIQDIYGSYIATGYKDLDLDKSGHPQKAWLVKYYR